jgi:hypothetical protein
MMFRASSGILPSVVHTADTCYRQTVALRNHPALLARGLCFISQDFAS